MRRRIGSRTTRTLLAVLAGAVATIALVSGAFAQETTEDPDADEVVVVTGGLLVPEGSTVGSSVIFNGPVRIAGTVDGTLVVFNGGVEITGTVREDVVAFNGRVVVRSGAEVGGDIVSRRPPVIEPGATVQGESHGFAWRFDAGDWFVGRLVWWVGYSVSTLLLGMLLLVFAPRLDAAVDEARKSRTGAVFGFGALVFFLLPIAAVALLVTIVGIPLGLFLLLALALIDTVGYVVGVHVFGRMIVKPPKSRNVAFLAGWGIARAVALVPVLGGLAWTVGSILGLGALWVAARRARDDATAPLPAVPPPPPSPTPA
ncbi:MAG TPA: polymer-forming cytoskeletal protein [Actinomycetota bacterium]